jgi:hypothetical protein
VKRAASVLAALGLATLAVAPASAATTSGAVKMTWNVSVAATLNLTTNYAVTTGAQGLGANVLQGAPAATCTSGTSEAAFNLTYGALTPSVSAAVACNYQKAIAASVSTNSTNWNVTQFLSAAAPTGIGFCAFSNGAASASAPASAQTTAPAVGTYTSGSLTGCATGGILIPAGTGGTGTAPGNPGTAGLVTATAPGTPAAFCSSTTAGTFSCGEDLQINLAANQPVATAQSSYLIVQLIAN